MAMLKGLGQARRRLAAALGAVALASGLAAVLSGCRAPQAGGGAARRTIQFWTLDLAPKFSPYINGVIADWERRHPGVDVVWTDVPWASVERKLLAAVFARTAPDVVNLNPLFAANLASKGGLRDLTPLLPPAGRGLRTPLPTRRASRASHTQPHRVTVWPIRASVTRPQ